MKYVIVEDSGSGLLFYKNVRNIFNPLRDRCRVGTSSGKDKIIKRVKFLFGKKQDYDISSKDEIGNMRIKSGDSLLLAMDNIEAAKGFNVYDIISTIESWCKDFNVNLYYANYYCIEELFLSYRYLSDMVKLGNFRGRGNYAKDDAYELLDLICDNIYDGNEYFKKGDHFDCVAKFINFYLNGKCHIKEKFLASVTANLFGSIYGDFVFSKGKLGKCWLGTCSDIKKKLCDYSCERCRYISYIGLEYITSLDKITHFEENSMDCIGDVSFSDYFK